MIRSLLSFCLRFFKSRIQLQLEIVYLRKQLEILTRTTPRPRLRPSDRFLFSILINIFRSWKRSLLIIKPETVIRWHQQGFKLYWRWKSRSALDRPKIPQEQINPIKQMANENPLWGAPRIHGERVIGSIRRECLDHLIIVNESHLRKVVKRYIHSYNNQRTHLGLNKDSPEPRVAQADGKIDRVAVANGLHHFYFRKAA